MSAAAPIAVRPVLTFDEAEHEYTVDGRRVESVTQVLKAVYGDLIWRWASEFAMERGRNVHAALHLWTLGDLDAKRLSSYIAGYVAAGVRFFQETGFEIAQLEGEPASELRMYSSIYDFAGTLDIYGTLNRRKALIDYKSGEPGWAAGPQLWAYSHLLHETYGEIVRDRYALQLHEDATYTLIPYKNTKDDQSDFLAALRVQQRRRILA